jgi:putative protease
MSLVTAHNKPLTTEKLTQQFGRLGNTPFYLASLDNQITDAVMLPVSELNRMRRDLVAQLVVKREQNRGWQLHQSVTYHDLLPECLEIESITPELIVLVRNTKQLEAILEAGLQTIYCELEDPTKYRELVASVRQFDPAIEIWIAPPRITKPRENYILEQVIRAEADGYLIRNYDQLKFFAQERKIGDFSLNIANPITAAYFQEKFGLERLTASYDLNIEQLTSLLQTAPPHWFEVTLHQHMPMFHMEHCVFCAFLSDGKDFRDCGRPCEQYEVKLRDRVGTEHVLQADAGCRNTVFNGVAQTGVESLPHLIKKGLRFVRLEFLGESPQQVTQTLQAYQQVLRGEMTGAQLWRKLNLQSQLGVTRGAML